MSELKKGQYLDILLRSKKTVFSTNDAALMWRESNQNAVKSRLNSYVKTGKLLPLRRGLYAKDENFNKLELAAKILLPSYVSFETVLVQAGVVFQYYETIFAASYAKREIECQGQKYFFFRLKKEILANPVGIDQSEVFPIATKERAFLDTMYRSKKYHFDNLAPLDWNKVFEILPIYKNKIMERRIQKIYDDYLKKYDQRSPS